MPANPASPTIDEVPPPGLRSRVLRGGSVMAARHGIGMVVSLIGVILITRIIGPTEYGKFAACLGIFTWFSYLAGWGIDIYVMRRPENDADESLYREAYTLLLLLSVTAAGLGLLCLRWLEQATGVDGFSTLISVFIFTLPVALSVTMPRVKLERALDYRKIAVIELITLTQFQATALVLAWHGFAAWSLIIAWALNQILSAVFMHAAAGYLPRLGWSTRQFRSMLRFGFGYTFSTATLQLRSLINPLIVTPLAGLTAAGYVGMASMFVFRLSVVKHLSEKMSVAALAKVQSDRPRVRALLGEGMRLHVICVGLPLAGFSLVGPWLIPLLMGEQWRPVAHLVPLLGIGVLCQAVFGLHICVLQIYDRNWDVAIFNVVMMVVLLAASIIFVPRLGFLGYGWAELCTLPTVFVIHLLLGRQVGSPDYRVALIWAAGLSLLMLSPWLGLAGYAAAGLVLLWPMTWSALGYHARQLRQAVVARV